MTIKKFDLQGDVSLAIACKSQIKCILVKTQSTFKTTTIQCLAQMVCPCIVNPIRAIHGTNFGNNYDLGRNKVTDDDKTRLD